jgi:lambda family phage portal protein
VNWIDRLILGVAPSRGLMRLRARAAASALMRYDAAAVTDRTRSLRAMPTDADAAAAQRARLAMIARDMVRNTPFATRAQSVICNNVVGDGIIPKVHARSKAVRSDMLAVIEQHFDTTDIDAAGKLNLYGLQRLAMNTVIDAGEVLIRRRFRSARDGLALPFQLEVLEPDYLDSSRDQMKTGGGLIRGGIEYDAIGRCTGYWLHRDHPGSLGVMRAWYESRFVPADEMIHLYRPDRPGQRRGVSWFAPVALQLQDMADYQEAQLLRQKIAACFAAFRVSPDADPVTGSEDPGGLSSLVPGRVQNLAPGEDIRFADPPGVEGYDEFTSAVLRAVAAGMGITYEALSGDMSRVNFSSARMGRMEMDRNVSSWQWLMMIPQFLQPLGRWAVEDYLLTRRAGQRTDLRLDWVPPRRVLVDPTREIPALRDAVRAGFASRQGVVRELGFDPERLIEEQREDREAADMARVAFDSDGRRPVSGGAPDIMVDPEDEADPGNPAPVRPANAIESARAEGRALAGAMADAIRALPAPVVNVEAPVVNVAAPQVRAGDVQVDVHLPRRGPVEKTVTGYDDKGRITGMTEREIDE